MIKRVKKGKQDQTGVKIGKHARVNTAKHRQIRVNLGKDE